MEDDDEVYEARLAERRREMEKAERDSAERVNVKVAELRKENPEPIKRSRMGARTFGTILLVEVGCVIWEKQDPAADYEARGGLVVEVTDDSEFTEDGEVIHHRAFRCFDFYRSPGMRSSWCTLTEEQVDLDACEPAQLARTRNAMRRMCRIAGGNKGTAYKEELELVTIAARLATVIGLKFS